MNDDKAGVAAAVGSAPGLGDAAARLAATIKHPASGRHPLDHASARARRAEEHLADLVKLVARRTEMQEQAIGVYLHPQRADQVVVNSTRHLPLDLKFSVLVGEICYNLRAALDYLIYELARLDTGSIRKRTKFLIEDCPKQFVGNIKDMGLTAAHVAAVERLQPYRGCEWTATLRDISNPDKHRTLIAIQAEHELTVHPVDKDHVQDFEDLPGVVRTIVTAADEVYVKIHLTTALQFGDGSPVIEPLARILEEVARTLEMFRSDFQMSAMGAGASQSGS
jgi:hypothetical protein